MSTSWIISWLCMPPTRLSLVQYMTFQTAHSQTMRRKCRTNRHHGTFLYRAIRSMTKLLSRTSWIGCFLSWSTRQGAIIATQTSHLQWMSSLIIPTVSEPVKPECVQPCPVLVKTVLSVQVASRIEVDGAHCFKCWLTIDAFWPVQGEQREWGLSRPPWKLPVLHHFKSQGILWYPTPDQIASFEQATSFWHYVYKILWSSPRYKLKQCIEWFGWKLRKHHCLLKWNKRRQYKTATTDRPFVIEMH